MSFWIYGLHAVQAALNNPQRSCLKLAKLPQVSLDIDPSNVEIINVDKNFFHQKFGQQAVHQGIALKIEPLIHYKNLLNFLQILTDKSQNSVIAILDQVTDPHNVGAIIRSAATMNIAALIIPHHQSVNLESPVLYKTASGGVEHLPIFEVVNLNQTIKMMKENNFWIIGLDELGSEKLNTMDLKGHFGLVLGAEGKGMRRLVQESCDYLAKLSTGEQFSTLNVSHAATVAFYEFHIKQVSN